ncbi:MAG: lipopolysaccharide heptosyltransferase I [Magnetococcales bacterium]|nr:lipopolysaccharide heptosyltransferase I [Magnetococcales bacterium]
MSEDVLLVKTSSMGDVLHMLPAVSDLRRLRPELRLWWLVEENLAMIPSWHPGVARVLPVALRRWRGQPWQAWRSGEVGRFLTGLRATRFRQIIDAQGLLKSALLAGLARGPVTGPAADWARERWALPCYRQRVEVQAGWHVVTRLRHLLAQGVGYACPQTPADFGLDAARLPALAPGIPEPFVVLLHGTAWPSKVWPEDYWGALGRLIGRGWSGAMLLPWGSGAEQARAQHLAAAIGPAARVLPRLGLAELAAVLARARAVVGLDSGLAHLAGVLQRPCVTLFGATNPDYSGIGGPRQRLLRAAWPCAPCMQRRCAAAPVAGIHPPCTRTLPPERVWDELRPLLEE